MISRIFVGRGNELAEIHDWLQNSSNGLALITGVGGIGKTSLLRKITEEYSAKAEFAVEYFDLAEQPMTMINQAVHLASSLGRGHYPEFMQTLTELDTASGEVTGGGSEVEAVNACVKETAAYLKSARKKLLRITDTFEIALRYRPYEEDWVGGINRKLKDIPGAFFIIAGRSQLEDENILEKIYPLLVEAFGDEKIIHVPLAGFNEIEASDFFAECDAHRMIPQEMREKLQLLTEGRPILLSLAVEWLQKEIPLPIMTEKSVSELRDLALAENERRSLLNQFEFELVSKVRELKNPLDIASLYMAHIDRRMDSRLLSELLDMDEVRAESYLKELLQLPFVKEYIGSVPPKCALHDEMRELVRKHAWRYLDLSGQERDRLTRTAIERYYIPRIEGLKQKKQNLLSQTPYTTLLQDAQAKVEDQERWLLEAETLYYFSRLNETEAFTFFDKTFYDRENSYIRDQFLLDELKRAGLNKNKVDIREADALRRRGHIEEAQQICSVMIERENLDLADRLHVYTALGTMYENNAPLKAEKSFLDALRLSEELGDVHVQGILHNNLGRLYRSMSRLQDSIHHFNEALNLLRRTGNLTMGSIIRNNLAWTYRLNGDLDEADVYCRLAIAENRKSGRERPLAYAYLTKADIDRDKGDLPNAELYVRQALEIFDRLDDDDGKAQAYRTQANISRYLHKFDQALDYLQRGIELSRGSESLPVLASLYQLYGRTIRHYETYLQHEAADGRVTSDTVREVVSFSQALEALHRSIDLSRQIGNRWEAARSQIEIVLIKMLEKKSYDEAELNKLLNQVEEIAADLDDHLLMGYVFENRARMDQQKGNYAATGRSLGKAAYHIAERTGLENARAFARFHNILLDSGLSDDQRIALAEGMIEQLQEQKYQKYPKLTALINMCEQILDLPKSGGDHEV